MKKVDIHMDTKRLKNPPSGGKAKVQGGIATGGPLAMEARGDRRKSNLRIKHAFRTREQDARDDFQHALPKAIPPAGGKVKGGARLPSPSCGH